MTAAIRIENLGKSYRVDHGQRRGGYRTFRDSLTDAVKAPFRRMGRRANDARAAEDFWALKDVSFEVKQGEVVGIIGRNGAGKSTLLKILSRITKPTRGRIELNGRVGSLLEVGTGFHPELTGRENIYLNGSILGMTRKEIERRFDEIVEFAEVERFLDTPVKRYSSGMYVRLAFAVAAHLEPEILIVDEVLAVGDAGFQKKCLNKMGEAAKGGRTTLLVSHNLGMIQALCHSAVVLHHGGLITMGPCDQAIQTYTELAKTEADSSSAFTAAVDESLAIQVLDASIVDGEGNPTSEIPLFGDVRVRIRHVVRKTIEGANLALSLIYKETPLLLSFDTDQSPELLEFRKPGEYLSEIQLPTSILKGGLYRLSLECGIVNRGVVQSLQSCLQFHVLETEYATFKSYSVARAGMMAGRLLWQAIPRGENP